MFIGPALSNPNCPCPEKTALGSAVPRLITSTEGSKVLTLDADKVATFTGAVKSTASAVTGLNYRTIYVDAGSMVPTVTNGAQAGTEEVTNTFDFYAFDTSTSEKVQFKMVMPEQWDAGTIKAKFYFLPTSTNTGTVQFSIAGVGLDTGDIISTSMGSAAVHTALAGNGTDNDVHITAATASCTIAGVPAAGELVLFEIARVVATDTYNADIHLLGVNIQDVIKHILYGFSCWFIFVILNYLVYCFFIHYI